MNDKKKKPQGFLFKAEQPLETTKSVKSKKKTIPVIAGGYFDDPIDMDGISFDLADV